jgi:pimeloyl-ACP methyl ester carboxylesterase
MSVLAIGGAQSFGATQAVVMRHAATQVTEVVIPQAGHWLMEEQPAATMAAIRTFMEAKP